jgi:glucan phosphoethanolaminetransferase (alkaline phosphatase superfamily)
MGQDDTSDGADYYDDTEYQRGLEMKETNTLYFVLFSILLVAVLILSKLLHEYRPLHKVLSEASLALLLSMSVGFVLDLVFTMQTESAEEADQVVQKLLSFSPNVFFMALLPPIIFNSGYQLYVNCKKAESSH